MALNSSLVITAGVVAVAYMYYRGRTNNTENGFDKDDVYLLSNADEADITHREKRHEERGVHAAQRTAEKIIMQANSGSVASHTVESDSLLNADTTSRYGGEHANVY